MYSEYRMNKNGNKTQPCRTLSEYIQEMREWEYFRGLSELKRVECKEYRKKKDVGRVTVFPRKVKDRHNRRKSTLCEGKEKMIVKLFRFKMSKNAVEV